MAEPQVIYEDEDFVAINKPAGLLVCRAVNSLERTLVDWLLQNYPEMKSVGDEPVTRPGIVHRLDKDTSGVMIAARSQKAFQYLKNLFKESRIKKIYLALVLGRVIPKTGVIKSPIGLKSGTVRRTTRVQGAKLVKPAETKYRALKSFEYGNQPLTLLEVQPLTGRTHQIRVHLMSRGYPVLGDQLYGGARGRELGAVLGLKRQFLHAESLEFTGRSGSRIKISADLPADLGVALDLLSSGRLDHHSRS